jgi:D-alanine-D-alanine ligase
MKPVKTNAAARALVVLEAELAEPSGEAELAEPSGEAEDLRSALASRGYRPELLRLSAGALCAALEALAARKGELVAVNLCRSAAGRRQSQPLVPAVLEAAGLRFVGNSASTLTCTLDRRITKAILYAAGIPTPGARVFRLGPAVDAVRDMSFPLIVKPIRAEGALAAPSERLARGPEELCGRLRELMETQPQGALAEVYLDGPEFLVALSGEGRRAVTLPVLESVSEGDAVSWRCPAQISEHLRVSLATAALAAYRALECRDVATVLLRLDPKGTPNVLRVDAAPELGRREPLARAIAVSGEGYEDFWARLVEERWSR